MAFKKTIVFDLDDTLIKEIDYIKSAFKEIAIFVDFKDDNLYNQMLKWYFDKENVFDNLIKIYSKIDIQDLKNIYRNHYPDFECSIKIKNFLENLKQKNYNLGLITDGFAVTQRNKIRALEIENLFDLIIISEEFGSEKPNRNNFEIFHQFASDIYFYVGDNLKKDFVTPNKLGWQTICVLNDGQNIHEQNFDIVSDSIYLPKHKISNLLEINNLI